MRVTGVIQYRALLALLSTMLLLSSCGVGGSTARTKTITWLVRSDMGAGIGKWETQVKDAFERAHPDIRVNVLAVPWAGYNAKLLALTAAHTPPDVYATFAAGFGAFLSKGTLADLTPYVQANHTDLHQWDASAIQALSRNGKLYGIPLDNMPSLVFYNATLFKQAHVPLPPTSWTDKSWTIQQMVTDAKAISKDTNNPTKADWGLNFGPGQFGTDVAWLWHCDPFSGSAGPSQSRPYQVGTVSSSDLHFDSPCYVTAMRWLKNLSLQEHVQPLPSNMTILSTLGDPFTTGRIGMETNGYWLFQSMFLDKPPFQWGVAPFPYGPGGDNLTHLWTDAWVMSKDAPHPHAAFDFMLFISTGSRAQDFAQTTGFFPALTSLDNVTLAQDARATGMAMTPGQLRSVILGGLATGQAIEAPGHTVDNFIQLNTIWTNTTDRLFLGTQSTAAAVAALRRGFEAAGVGLG